MALKTLVKLSSVTNLTDARYAAGMGVEIIGFPLENVENDPTTIAKFNEIASWLAGVKIAGEFGHASAEKIIDITSNFSINFIQTANKEVISKISKLELPIIFSINLDGLNFSELLASLSALNDSVSFFLLERSDDLDLMENELEALAMLTSSFPIILGYGVSPQNLDKVMQEVMPLGLSLKGGQEIKPGFKDLDKLADILELLDTE